MAEHTEEFDWDAYHRDTRELSLDAKGAWWDCLYKMRLSATRGRISMPLSSYARMFGSTAQKAQRVIAEIAQHGVGDLVVESDGSWTLINRRMFRAWQVAESARLRQAKRRGHGDVTEMSQTETSFSGNSEKNVTGRKPSNSNNLGNVSRTCHKKVTNRGKSPSSVEEESINGEELLQQKQRAAVTRIPDPFPLTEPMREWATVNCPGLSVETAHENFVEYYTNLTTAKARKLDWLATWRKGMKLALKWQKENERRGQIGKHDPSHPEPVQSVACGFCGEDYCLRDHRFDKQKAAA